MNMKKIKKFFAMTRQHEGFTLVELIVVIAILAILGGVAIPAYSGYITKANMAADRSLISDVADALTLYYYGSATESGSGYVVLSMEGAKGDAGLGAKAMQEVFGDGWETAVKLKYSQWDGDLAQLLAGYSKEDLELINNSSYLTNSSADGLMTAVTKMTGLASTVIGNKNLSEDVIKNNLQLVLGDNAESIIETLSNNNLLQDSTAISNMLVGAMADSLAGNEALQTIVNDYAAAFAYAQSPGGSDDALLKMQENLERVNMMALTDKDAAFALLYDGIDGEKYDGFYAYIDAEEASGQLGKDQDALVAMMGAVKEITGNFQDKKSLTNKELFTSSGVMSQVNSYINSVKALAGMDPAMLDVLKDIPEGAVAVLITADGVVAVCPGDAWMA